VHSLNHITLARTVDSDRRKHYPGGQLPSPRPPGKPPERRRFVRRSG
jgi:hypothetical protein